MYYVAVEAAAVVVILAEIAMTHCSISVLMVPSSKSSLLLDYVLSTRKGPSTANVTFMSREPLESWYIHNHLGWFD